MTICKIHDLIAAFFFFFLNRSFDSKEMRLGWTDWL